ncbi:MAG: 2-amino-4-hydroxy-6-hydroxymethyldihydropteridine diphosphokinase, partial [Lentisphaeria bacterium]|nr:2-amino-4-hydroxy-6-hydroxymethyldihydropteridine diphosphokinase [Lentisphaeria bacterium]
GRPGDHARNVSRTLDLDLILFGDIRMNTPELILPHPRAKDRDFVCIPLAEIAPELLTQLRNTP